MTICISHGVWSSSDFMQMNKDDRDDKNFGRNGQQGCSQTAERLLNSVKL